MGREIDSVRTRGCFTTDPSASSSPVAADSPPETMRGPGSQRLLFGSRVCKATAMAFQIFSFKTYARCCFLCWGCSHRQTRPVWFLLPGTYSQQGRGNSKHRWRLPNFPVCANTRDENRAQGLGARGGLSTEVAFPPTLYGQ